MDLLFPLRVLHGKIHQTSLEWKKKRHLQRPLFERNRSTILVPGSPLYPNLGDSAITIAQISFLQKCGIPPSAIKEITSDEYDHFRNYLKFRKKRIRLVTQLGGGNMGNQWPREEYFHRCVTKDFPTTPMIIFPQTIYFTPDETGTLEKQRSISTYNGHKELTIVARESESHKIMTGAFQGPDILLIPDIVLSATMETFGASPSHRQGILFCLRNDAERSMDDGSRQRIIATVRSFQIPSQHTDMYSDYPVTKDDRAELVRIKLEEFSSSRLVITDRLHGMIFAALTGTPCIVFSNYNHKVKGTYDWISYLPYIRYARSVEDVERYLPELLEMKDCKFDNTPLIPYFNKLAEVVRKYAHN